ncbi:MAG: hypothetical protein FVQ86_06065 [candidate division NC10 bacterium]|nr:hypothetical protein [candidate division NC10 bacterium]
MTTTDWKTLARELREALGLQTTPLAIAFSNEAPAGVRAFDGPMPEPAQDGRTGKVSAGCVFWMHGVERPFTTIREDHFNCSVGSVTHGLKKLEEVMDNEDVKCLVESEWVSLEEALRLPFVKERYRYITYAPLAETPVDPDVVLLRINAFQVMAIQDTFKDVVMVGKPQCHIVPISKEQNRVAISTGCMLSRVRTGMSPDEMTCTIPARRLEEVVERLWARRAANAAVAAYANRDSRRFGGG